MAYIITLFLIIGIIFIGFTGSMPFDLNATSIMSNINNAFDDFKEKTYGFVFPRSENEILIDNLGSNYSLLDKFFSQSSDVILNSKDISETEKETLRQAMEAYGNTRSQVKILGASVIENEPGIIKSIVKKTLGLSDSSKNPLLSNEDPSTTYIPPQCQLVCNE